MRHSIYNLIDRAVAAGRQYQVGATLDRTSDNFGRHGRSGGGNRFHIDPTGGEQEYGALESALPPPQAAGDRIVNKKRFTIRLDSTLSIVDAQESS